MENKKELSLEEKLALRESVRRKLEEIEFNPNRRIKLPKERLEEILFDGTENDKAFGYFGEGLCKLDLSEVSFDGVSLASSRFIDLSNTNIKIDFRKLSPDFYNKDWVRICNIDFTNVDLSNSHFEDRNVCDFYRCSFKNTKISLNTARVYYINKCDLTGLDLSSTILYSMAWKYERRDGKDPDTLECRNNGHALVIRECNLSDTHATIKEGPDNPNELYVIKKFSKEKSRRQIGKLMAKGYLKNCIIEDETIKPIYSRKELLEMEKDSALIKIYDVITDTLALIDEQIKSFENESAADMTESTGSGSFYGCDNVPEVTKTSKGKKLKNTMNLGSFYGCGNVPGEE